MVWSNHKSLSKYYELIMSSPLAELVQQDQETSAGIKYLIFKVKFSLIVSFACIVVQYNNTGYTVSSVQWMDYYS